MNKLVIMGALVALATACAKKDTANKDTEDQTGDTPATEQTRAEPAADTPAPDQAAARPAADQDPAQAQGDAKGLGPAPDFTLKDLDGNEVSLSQYRGKTVVLEWFNPGCPFVNYAHSKGPLTDMGAQKSEQGIVWLAINSGAPGKQGHGVEPNKKAAGEWNIDYPILLDESGEVGKAYGAKTTPHMYIINSDGALVYRGAIDNAPLGEVNGDTHINYVDKALAALSAGQPIEPAETKPYGCSVKYAD